MSVILTAHELKKAFGERPLFKSLTFSIHKNERIGLIGPNGAGKSTLLRILAQEMDADFGTVAIQKNARVVILDQSPQFKEGATVAESVLGDAIANGDWETSHQGAVLIHRFGLESIQDQPIETLSGGQKKRVALAREWLKKPDLLLLDEPTNHLDIENILLLEEMLDDAPFASLTVTHDRAFLQRIATRMIEVNRRFPDGLFSAYGDYVSFLESRDAFLTKQESTEEKMRNTLRRETEWLRQGAKARTTKQKARIDRAEELQESVNDIVSRNDVRTARLDFQTTGRTPKKLIKGEGISKSFEGRKIFSKLDLTITSKTRLGLLGKNGSGKSTLIRVLLGEEPTDSGQIERSDFLKVAYFEQNRDALDPKLTAKKMLCPSGETVDFCGRKMHIRGYLDRFLFSPEQMNMAIGKLSGGEQSRLLIAKLMLQEANLLVLDEPTNDLDLNTLDVLADVLEEFDGAVILVSHDRFFIDHVTTELLSFQTNDDGQPELMRFHGVRQWEAHVARTGREKSEKRSEPGQLPPRPKAKLSFHEKRELEGMEENILGLESKLRKLETALTNETMSRDDVNQTTREMAALQAEVDRMYTRWDELSRRA